MVAGSASAATVTVVFTCGTISDPINFGTNPPSNPGASGTFSCQGTSGLGAFSSISGAVLYDSDYSNGAATPVNETATFAITLPGGWTAVTTSDTVTTTGGGNSTGPVSSNATINATFNNNSTLVSNGIVLPGFTDALTGITAGVNSFNVAFSQTFNSGSALQGTGDVQVEYTYTTVSTGTPEPVSMLLFGTGLLAVSLAGRKKFSRK